MSRKKPTIPDFRKVNKAQLAEVFGVSLPTVESWLRKGMPVLTAGSRGVSWEFDLQAVIVWRGGGQQDPTAPVDPDRLPPQDRRAWYDAERLKRSMAADAKELLQRVDVEETVARAFAALRQDILAIPDHLERLHGLGGDVAEAVEHALHGALDTCANRLATLAPTGEGG